MFTEAFVFCATILIGVPGAEYSNALFSRMENSCLSRSASTCTVGQRIFRQIQPKRAAFFFHESVVLLVQFYAKSIQLPGSFGGRFAFIFTGTLQPLDELQLLYGPVLSGANVYAAWTVLPSWPTLQPLTELLFDTPEFFVMFLNTCKQVFPQVLGQILIGALAAWAFSRLRFRGRKLLFSLYIILMLLPFQVTMVANYLVLDRLHLIDTIFSIVLPGIFATFPVFIMKKGFDHIPHEMLEAAALDGATPLQTFIRVRAAAGGTRHTFGICFGLLRKLERLSSSQWYF